MTGKKTGGKKKKGKSNLLNAALIGFVVLAIAVAGGIAWVLYLQHASLEAKQEARAQSKQQAAEKRIALMESNPPPKTLLNDSVDQTVRYAAQHGWYPCTGDCLQLSQKGWHHQNIQGFPPSYIWMDYRYSDGTHYYSQHHIGHIIRAYPDRPAEDVGLCPVCHGIGWIRKDGQDQE